MPSRQSARTLKAKSGPLDTAFKAEYGQGTRAGHVLSGHDEEAKDFVWEVDNDETLEYLARIALSHAVAEGGRAAFAGLTFEERETLAVNAITAVLNTLSPLVDPENASISLTSLGESGSGEQILVRIDYTDTRFTNFPFVPERSDTISTSTIFVVADPSS